MIARPLLILYVEDNALIRESFAELLAHPERQIVAVANCTGAWEALRKQHVNLLVIDVDLPDGSGLDVARGALRENPGMPVIICSGHDVRDDARSLGPTAHSLMKPFELEELEALIGRLAPPAT